MLLPQGKLDAALLSSLLEGLPQPAEVLVGPGIGHDVTVIDLGHDELIVAKTDPITFAADAIGYYAVAVNANDIAMSGGRAEWLLVTVLLPTHTATPELVATIMGQLRDACARVGVALTGGHTEVTDGVARPIVVGHMLGRVAREQLVRPDGAYPGDAVIMTKGYPIEGVSLMARDYRETLLQRGFAPAELDRWASFLYEPGILVIAEAEAITGAVRPHTMHDPTEGGLATALWEMAQASGVGLRIDRQALPLLPEGEVLCREFGLDPLGTIASGALLAAVSPDDEPVAISACHQAGIACRRIGVVTKPEEGVVLVGPGPVMPLPRFDQDEITRLP